MGKLLPGEFEQVVLLSVLRLGDDATGRRIFEEIERLSVTPVALTAVYVTLSRLQEKGYVQARQEIPETGGRAQKHFSLLPPGMTALRRTREQFERFWDGVDLDAVSTEAGG